MKRCWKIKPQTAQHAIQDFVSAFRIPTRVEFQGLVVCGKNHIDALTAVDNLLCDFECHFPQAPIGIRLQTFLKAVKIPAAGTPHGIFPKLAIIYSVLFIPEKPIQDFILCPDIFLQKLMQAFMACGMGTLRNRAVGHGLYQFLPSLVLFFYGGAAALIDQPSRFQRGEGIVLAFQVFPNIP